MFELNIKYFIFVIPVLLVNISRLWKKFMQLCYKTLTLYAFIKRKQSLINIKFYIRINFSCDIIQYNCYYYITIIDIDGKKSKWWNLHFRKNWGFNIILDTRSVTFRLSNETHKYIFHSENSNFVRIKYNLTLKRFLTNSLNLIFESHVTWSL